MGLFTVYRAFPNILGIKCSKCQKSKLEDHTLSEKNPGWKILFFRGEILIWKLRKSRKILQNPSHLRLVGERFICDWSRPLVVFLSVHETAKKLQPPPPLRRAVVACFHPLRLALIPIQRLLRTPNKLHYAGYYRINATTPRMVQMCRCSHWWNWVGHVELTVANSESSPQGFYFKIISFSDQ